MTSLHRPSPSRKSPKLTPHGGPKALAAPATSAIKDVYRQDQPHGEDGIRFSLKRVCMMIAEGRLHPDVRSWTTKKLAAVGNPKGAKARAKALLEAVRAQSGWVPDPIDAEFMAGAHLTLGDGDKPPYFALGDCFPEGTLVLSDEHELVPIETLGEGMKIWGLDRWSTVQRVGFKGTLAVDAILLNNGSDLKLTPDHHVYVLDCTKHAMLEEGDEPTFITDAKPCSCSQEARTEKRTRVANVRPGMLLPAPSRSALVSDSGPTTDLGDMRAVVRVTRDVEALPCWDITTDDHRVYLPEHDVTVSQCDDLTIALGSAILAPLMYLTAAGSVGTRAAVVGHAYGTDRNIEHVLGAIFDPNDNKWYYVDPSLKDMPFGECRPFTRERVYLVPSAELLCDDRVCLAPGGRSSGAPPMPRRGDFVAVNGAPGMDLVEPPSWVDGVPNIDGRPDENETLVSQTDLTGILEATVTFAPPETAAQIENEALFQLWQDLEPCGAENPLHWCDINPPVSTDYAAQELYQPWHDGLEPYSGASWLIPDSGFLPK